MNVVIIGLGYVGLPLAQEAVRVGLNVTGFDVNPKAGRRPQRRPQPHRRPVRRRHRDDGRGRLPRDHRPGRAGRGQRARRDRDLRPDPAVGIRRPRPDRGQGRDRVRRGDTQAGRAGRPGVDHLPGHHRRDRPPDAGEGDRAGRRDRLPPGVLPGADRPGQRGLRHPQHAQGRRRPHPGLHRGGRGLLRHRLRHGRQGQDRPRGRDGQAPGEHVPARQHRAGQRDGDLLPRARRRPVGRDRLRRHQAVRLPGVLPGPRRRRALHPDRPELPLLQGAGRAQAPVPLRRAGPGDQLPDAGLRRRPRGRAAQHRRQAAQRGEGAAARRHLQEGHRRPAGEPGPPDRPQAAAARGGAQLPRPVRGQLAGRRPRRAAGRLAGRRRRPHDPAPGAHRVRPGRHRRRRRTCCSTPVARSPETRFTRSKASPGGRPPDPPLEAQDARRRLHGRASPGRRADLLPRDPRPARRGPRRHLHRPARRAGATAPPRPRSRSEFSRTVRCSARPRTSPA